MADQQKSLARMQDQLKDLEKARDAAASRAAKQSGTLAEQEQALAAARKGC